MSVYLSKCYRETLVKDLPNEMQNDIRDAAAEVLKSWSKDLNDRQQAWNQVLNSRVCDVDGAIQVVFVDEQLSYYVVENLRFQQDCTGGFKIDRYDNLQDAIRAFKELPDNFTSALGARLTGGKFGVGELDLVHRKNGEPVQVNDFKFSERWDNPLVHRAVDHLNFQLGIVRESDLRTFNKSVLIPVQPWEPQTLNSYFMDKYLRPVEGAEKEVQRKYGDPAMYDASHPVHSEHLHSSVNEVFVFGEGWIKGEEFFKRLYSINEYESPERLKVESLNINYVDMNGRVGQADIAPLQFALLKKQTLERTARHPGIDDQIEAANKIRMDQLEKQGRDNTKDQKRDPVTL